MATGEHGQCSGWGGEHKAKNKVPCWMSVVRRRTQANACGSSGGRLLFFFFFFGRLCVSPRDRVALQLGGAAIRWR